MQVTTCCSTTFCRGACIKGVVVWTLHIVLLVKVLGVEAIYLMGFDDNDRAFLQSRIQLFGVDLSEDTRFYTTVLVQQSLQAVCLVSHSLLLCMRACLHAYPMHASSALCPHLEGCIA